MVICVVPVPVILESVTAIVSTVESSEDFLMVMLPLATSTASLKVRTILASTATPVAPSAGVEEDKTGLVRPPSEKRIQLSVAIILALAVAPAPALYLVTPALKKNKLFFF